ncbi:MAG: acetyltransferase [Microcoleus sp. SU_5_3]|nr:acetyltransferase [Microcoleus sp. SU_5_3]
MVFQYNFQAKTRPASDIDGLISPAKNEVLGRNQAGEEEQEPANFPKGKLVFPSGEILPRCWTEENYKTN